MLLVMSSSLDKNKSISRREAGTTGGTTQGQCLHLHSKTFPQRIPKQGAAATKNQAGERIMPEGREIKQRDKKGSWREARNGAALAELGWEVQVRQRGLELWYLGFSLTFRHI